jgi:hypothetical protein
VLLGATFTTATKLTWATGVMVGGWGMYRLLVHWLDASARRSARGLDGLRLAAAVGALIYVYAPYRLLDMYVRGALNESLLLMWLPWLFLSFYRLLVQGSAPGWQRRLALAILVLAATWLTHSFAILAVTPLLIAFILFRLLGDALHDEGWGEVSRRTALAAAAGVGAMLLCAAFLIPFAAESRLLDQRVYISNTYNFRNHFVFLGQYFSPFWGYGYSDDPTGAKDGMGFQVGALALTIGLASLVAMGHAGRQRGLMAFLAGATALVMLVMTPAALGLWDALPLMGVIQFPWRLLLLATFCVSALAGITLGVLLPLVQQQEAAAGLLVFGLLAVHASSGYADPALQPVEPWREDGRAVYRFEKEFPDMMGYTLAVSEPYWVSPMSEQYAADSYLEEEGVTQSLTRFGVLSGAGTVTGSLSQGSVFSGDVLMDEPGVVRAYLTEFPGWQVRVDGVLTPHRLSDPHGLVEFDVTAGRHHIEVLMESTPARRLGMWISWAMAAVVALLFFWPVGSRRETITPPAQTSTVGA